MLKIEKVDLHLIEVRRNTGFPSQHVIVELTSCVGVTSRTGTAAEASRSACDVTQF